MIELVSWAQPSFEIRNVAAHCRCRLPAQRFARDGRFDSVCQFVRRRTLSRVTKILVQIVNPAVINQPPVGVENRGLRSDLRLALLHQNMSWVAEGGERIAKLAIVLTNRIGRFFLAWINQKESHLVSILRAQLLNCRS